MAATKSLREQKSDKSGVAVRTGKAYSAMEMVDKHYSPRRNGGNRLPCEREDIASYAAAYKLGKKGLRALADYMNDITARKDLRVRSVPPKVGDIAREHRTNFDSDLGITKGKRTEPTIMSPGAAASVGYLDD